jgi:hypothetical protein
MTSQDIARKWVALLGVGLHPDNTGMDYTPPLPKAMRVAYDNDMVILCDAPDYEGIILTEMEKQGLIS